jgi:hypothetical protein
MDQHHRTQFQGITDLGCVSLDWPCVVDIAGYGHANKNLSDGSAIPGFAVVLLTM